MNDSEPLVLLRAELDCGKSGGLSSWFYIAAADVDQHWIEITFAEFEDAHDLCDLLSMQTTFFQPGSMQTPVPDRMHRWTPGNFLCRECEPTPAQRARIAPGSARRRTGPAGDA